MAITLNTIKPVGATDLTPCAPAPTSVAPAAKRFVMGSTGLGKFGGNSTQALARSVAVLGGNYDTEGMGLVRNARVTNIAACVEHRAEVVGTIYNLAKPGR